LLRRVLPWLLGLGGGVLALVAGLLGLQSIFASEREQALDNLRGRRRALSQYAGQLFKEALEEKLAARREDLQRALKDPLVFARDLLYVHRGTQWLPRPVRFRPGTATPARDLYHRLEQLRRLPPAAPERGGAPAARRVPAAKGDAVAPGGAPDLAAEGPRRTRTRLYLRFRAALVLGQRGRITRTFRDLLAHRARFLVAARWDLPFMLVVLETFSAYTTPDPDLMRDLLRDGLRYARGRRMEGLQRRLLRQRHRFTRPDFAFLVDRLAALCGRHGVPAAAFLREAHRRRSPAVALPGALPGPVLMRGRWYAVPEGNRIRGVRVEPPKILSDIAHRMRELHLVRGEDSLQAPAWGGSHPLDDIAPAVRSPRWARQRAAIGHRYRLKTGLGVLTGLLALVVLGGALLFIRRRQRYVELKSDFVASVSHELRTPLSSIRLLSETLERKIRDHPDLPERVRQYPGRILRDVEGLSFLVENLLSFNRLDKGRWTLRREPVPLAEVMADLEDDLDTATPSSRSVEIETEGVDDVVLDADPELMRLLWHNLGRNACQYNERDPVRLTLRAEPRGRMWHLWLQDNGVGIPQAERERIFQEFYRITHDGRGSGRARSASGARENHGGQVRAAVRGSGLGLAMCRRILRLHGGDLRVADTGPDGTTFELWLPRASS
jgi:signal transduction histidine kinase